ncbi:MAG: efflux RND transporter permease subunit, partial [Gammaproteobacteria bacterium]|nr:efflux RND transporter permease subunit [Gammaproteobacteria bacterium]
PQTDRDSIGKIKMLPIVTPTGAHIPLVDVAKIYVADGPPIIKSENARLTGWILVDLNTTDIGSYINLAKIALDKNLKLEPGYSLVWSGQYEYMKRAKERLMMVGPLTLGIIILLLYLNFRQMGEVLIILLTLPLALTGGIWLLYFLNYNLSVAVGVGFIALSGVAVEIGVIMLVYLNQAWKEAIAHAEANQKLLTRGALKQAIIHGALLRVRPIIMTVSATIAGLLPIMIGSSGTGSNVMRRIAAPMVGGMVSATLLTLIVIPAVYYLWKGVSIKK